MTVSAVFVNPRTDNTMAKECASLNAANQQGTVTLLCTL